MTDPGPPKRRRGCLFYGCLIAIVCMLAILGALLLGVHTFKRMLNTYTDTTPMPLPTVQMSPAQIAQVQQRVDEFRDRLRAGLRTSPLALTADDLNALVASSPDLKAAKGKVYVSIEANRLRAQVSLPLEDVGLPRFRGRYLNGIANLGISLRDGILDVTAQNIVVHGKPLPAPYMNRIRRENLAAKVNENSRASVALNQLEDIQVKDGKLVITPKEP